MFIFLGRGFLCHPVVDLVTELRTFCEWHTDGLARARRVSVDDRPTPPLVRRCLYAQPPCCRRVCVCVCVCDAEMAQFDYDYEQTTDGRYDLRPYGPYLPSRYRRRDNVAVITELQMTSLVTLLMLQRAVSCSVAQP